MRLFHAAVAALLLIACAVSPQASRGQRSGGSQTVWVLTTDGRTVEGSVKETSIAVSENRETREIKLKDLLSFNSGSPLSGSEMAQVEAGIKALNGPDRAARDRAVADLAEIGLPVMTPLLAAYKDTDHREPDTAHRLFSRLVPGFADGLDRRLDLVRLSNGIAIRCRATVPDLEVRTADGKQETLPGASIRRLAVRRDRVEHTATVDALKHCTQIEFLDTGIRLSAASRVDGRADGYARLAFNEDGWSSDPDGIKVPGPNYKTTDVDGFAFGALVARIAPMGERWKMGRVTTGKQPGAGRLQLAVNDNPHWQNNVGSYRVRVRATDAYDMGDPQ